MAVGRTLDYLLVPIGLLGYFSIGAMISAVICGVVLWATGQMPAEDAYEVYWQGQLGWALGYGFVTAGLSLPVWLLLSLARTLRWIRAFRIALAVANALMITVIVFAFATAA